LAGEVNFRLSLLSDQASPWYPAKAFDTYVMTHLGKAFLLLFVFVGRAPLANASLPLPVRQEQAEDQENASPPIEVDDRWRGPLSNRNQFPPALLFVSLEPERARVLTKGERTIFVGFDYSNVLVVQETESGSLQIDLESLRTLVQGRFGLGKHFEIAAGLPIYWMQGGFLDPFISDFHNTFHLPNRVRAAAPNNIFRYEWRVGDTPVLEREDGFVALGDLTLQVKRALVWKALGATELAARAAVKLPTGSEELVSSGRPDLGFGVELSRVGRKVGGFFNLNYQVLSDLDHARSKNFFSWMAAFDWRFKPALSAVVQYDEFKPFLESDISILNQSGRQLILGLRWRRSDRFLFEWHFAEDLSASVATAAPDFTFGFEMTYKWKRKLH
jgi:Protein of unknown function (DUF3187)